MLTFYGNCICTDFNYSHEKSEFPCLLKHLDVVPVHKKEIQKLLWQIMYQSAFFPIYLKFMRN